MDYVPGDFKLVDGNQIVVTFSHGVAFPLALVFGLTSKVVSDDVSLGTRKIDEGRERGDREGKRREVIRNRGKKD